jgi:hypothetical protein
VRGEARADTDAEVIEASLREPERFAALYDRHHQTIHRYLARRLGRDEADDLMAETFLIAFRQRGRYDLTCANARPWLYGIATHLVGRHHRTENRFWRLIARTGVDPAVESPSERVTERVTAQGMRRELAAALAVVVQQTGGSGPEAHHTMKNVSAAEILRRAAASARSEPELHLRDGQYLYVRSKIAWGPGLSHPGQAKGGETREVWLSVDGSKPGLLRSPCWKNPARTCDEALGNADAPKDRRGPVPGSYPWMLQNVPKLLNQWRAELTRPNPHPTEPPGKGAWEGVNDLLGENYLPPKLRAAIFDFLVDVPGTKVVSNATAATGRPGIAVTKTMYGTRSEFVFDPTTYRYLGKREIYLGPAPHITDWRRQPEGSNFDLASTILEIKAVDHLPSNRPVSRRRA